MEKRVTPSLWMGKLLRGMAFSTHSFVHELSLSQQSFLIWATAHRNYLQWLSCLCFQGRCTTCAISSRRGEELTHTVKDGHQDLILSWVSSSLFHVFTKCLLHADHSYRYWFYFGSEPAKSVPAWNLHSYGEFRFKINRNSVHVLSWVWKKRRV